MGVPGMAPTLALEKRGCKARAMPQGPFWSGAGGTGDAAKLARPPGVMQTGTGPRLSSGDLPMRRETIAVHAGFDHDLDPAMGAWA
jgi:hypothetical protein